MAKKYNIYNRKKRTYKRKKKSTYGTRYRMTVPSGMPLQRRAYLRYSTGISLTTTLGALATHTFRANGIYDPDQSGIGVQPMGRDEWAALFNHSCVVKCKITVKNVFTDSSNPKSWGVYLSDDVSIPYTSWTGFSEAKRGSVKFTGGYDRVINSGVATYDAKKFYNLKDIKDNVDRVGAATGANPGEEAYFNIWFATLNAVTETQRFVVTMDFVVDFSEPKDMPQS